MCQQIWKTQQWPEDQKRVVFDSSPKEGQYQRIFKLPYICAHFPCKQRKESESRSIVSDSHATPWTGMGSLSLLQGIFPTWGSNPGLPLCRWILCQLSHKGSPRILEWVAYPFSRGSSQFRNRTWVSQHCRQILYQLSYHGRFVQVKLWLKSSKPDFSSV